jgi:UDP-2,3-diacylglucosamine pyrophosphatase LpxH
MADNSAFAKFVFRHHLKNNVSFPIFFMGDFHLDARKTDVGFIERELEKARELDARIILLGDIFDGIWCGDPRYMPAVSIQRLEGRNQLIRETVQYGKEFLKPYADLIDIIAIGNHEETVLKHHHYNLIQELCRELTTDDHVVNYGKRSGNAFYRFEYPNGGAVQTVKIHYTHGSGGSAPVTDGLIKMKHKKIHLEGFDIHVSGHTHTQAYAPKVAFYPSDNDAEMKERHANLICVGSYGDLIEDGWESTKEFAPQRKGGYYADVQLVGKYRDKSIEIRHITNRVRR